MNLKTTSLLAALVVLGVSTLAFVATAPPSGSEEPDPADGIRYIPLVFAFFIAVAVALAALFLRAWLRSRRDAPTDCMHAFLEGIGSTLAVFPPSEARSSRTDVEAISDDLEAVLPDFASVFQRNDRKVRFYSPREDAHVVT